MENVYKPVRLKIEKFVPREKNVTSPYEPVGLKRVWDEPNQDEDNDEIRNAYKPRGMYE